MPETETPKPAFHGLVVASIVGVVASVLGIVVAVAIFLTQGTFRTQFDEFETNLSLLTTVVLHPGLPIVFLLMVAIGVLVFVAAIATVVSTSGLDGWRRVVSWYSTGFLLFVLFVAAAYALGIFMPLKDMVTNLS